MIPLSQIFVFQPFEPSLIGYLILLVVLLFCSALASGSETALFSLSPGNIHEIKKRDTRSDKAILKLLSTQDYTLGAILILNNLVNICIVILTSKIIDMIVLIQDSVFWEFLVKTVLATFILLLFGEIIPKIYASYNPLGVARLIARPMVVVKNVFRPFAWLLVRSSGGLKERVSRRKKNISMDDLSDALEITEDQSAEEKQMLSGIVSFINTEAADIMVLRIDIVALDMEAPFSVVKKTIIDSGYSRLPVYENNIDTIKGILYVKDMTPFIGQDDNFHWQAHIRKAYFVPEHKKINDLLEEFQTEKVHMAVVVDEYGATQGLVSLEDILEEIVGDITDESDTASPTFYKRLNDNTYIFEGKTHINDLEKVLELESDYFGDICDNAETLAGLLLEIKHDFLKKGESVTSHGIKFTVEALDGRRIDKVKVQTGQ